MTEKVTDLTVTVSEYVDEANLQTFERFVNLFGAVLMFFMLSIFTSSLKITNMLLYRFLASF